MMLPLVAIILGLLRDFIIQVLEVKCNSGFSSNFESINSSQYQLWSVIQSSRNMRSGGKNVNKSIWRLPTTVLKCDVKSNVTDWIRITSSHTSILFINVENWNYYHYFPKLTFKYDSLKMHKQYRRNRSIPNRLCQKCLPHKSSNLIPPEDKEESNYKLQLFTVQ